jgi:hypothetical protein
MTEGMKEGGTAGRTELARDGQAGPSNGQIRAGAQDGQSALHHALERENIQWPNNGLIMVE